jgi:hypothetical protein
VIHENEQRILNFGLLALFSLSSAGCELAVPATSGAKVSSAVIARGLQRSANVQETSRDLLIVGQFSTKKTYLFDKNDKKLGTIPALAGNYATDEQGTLYDTPYGNESHNYS